MPSEVKQEASSTFDKHVDALTKFSTDEDICYEVGPIIRARTVDVVGLLSGLRGINVEIRESQSLGKSYWVYLKGDGGKDVLEAKQKELLDKKIDSFVITEGELAHSISLGIFDKQENATKRKDELTSLGYQVKIKEVAKSVDDAWVLVRSSKSNQMIQAINENTLQQKLSGFGRLEIRKFDCHIMDSVN